MSDTGESAFPIQVIRPDGGVEVWYGLSLRDYFAGQALIGLIQNPASSLGDDAIAAFQAADAMLKAREVSP